MEHVAREPRIPHPVRPKPADRSPRLTRPLNPSAQPSADHLLLLQRTLGNRATNALLSGIQAKLTVGAAGDAYEQEADRVADQVMSGTTLAASEGAAGVQRQEDEDEIQTRRLQRQLAQRQGEEEEIQTSRGFDPLGSFEAGPAFEDRLAASRGGGQPLPGETRDFMEQRFGADLGDVRVHTGGEAAALNREVSAQAFTHGSDIYLGEGKFAPGTTAGKHLLAHELAHVVQQTGPRALQRGGLVRMADRGIRRIRRFSSAAISQDHAIDWAGETTSVKRSGEGLNGGVFFFKSAGGDVVVKAIPESDRASVRMMEETLKAVGVARTESRRVVPGDSEEAQAIRAQIASKLVMPEEIEGDEGAEADYREQNQQVADEAGCFLVQPRIEGQSLMGLIESAARGQVEMDAFILKLKNPNLLREFGRMMAVDAFTHFYDRMYVNFNDEMVPYRLGMNPGNMMVTEGPSPHAVAIDNSFGIRDVEPDMIAANGQLDALRAIIEKSATWPHTFFEEGIIYYLKRRVGADFDAVGYFRQNFDIAAGEANLAQGIQAGLTRLRQLVAGSKGARSGIKAQASADSAQMASWAGFKVSGVYLQARDRGANHQAALAEAMAYSQLRKGYADWEPRLQGAVAFDHHLDTIPPKPGRLEGMTASGKLARQKYDAAYQAFLRAVLDRTELLGTLAADFDPLLQRGNDNGPAAAEARKLLAKTLAAWRSGTALGDLFVAFTSLFNRWSASLDAKDPRSAELRDVMKQLGSKISALTSLLQRASSIVKARGEQEAAAAAAAHHWTPAATPPPNKPNK